jgi:hypothetical protein
MIFTITQTVVSLNITGLGRGGLAIVVMRQLPRGFFFENAKLFLKIAWHFKEIFREFEAFLKISILFEDISEKLRLFLINVRFYKNCKAS